MFDFVEKSLLTEICQNPQDEMVRLIYADRLEEISGGDESHPLMIQADMIREKTYSYIPGGWRVVFPEISYWAVGKNMEVWIDGKRWRRRTSRFAGLMINTQLYIRRGFLWKVVCDWETWDQIGKDIVIWNPITRVENGINARVVQDISYWYATDIPSTVWKYLGKYAIQSGRLMKTYSSQELALLDLSEANLKWARSK